MASMERKLRRKKKKDAEEEMSEKIGLFDKIPQECSACETAFDKTNREMVSSWRGVVREKEGIVRRYCPTCWDTATKILNDVEESNV